MVNKTTIALASLLVAIIGLIPFSGLMELIVTPNFKVDVGYSEVRDGKSYQGVEIENIGLLQAKNALASISSSYPLLVDDSHCVEGNIINNNSTNVQISFERFSQNVTCTIIFFSQYESIIFKVEVTADNSEGYTYSYGNETITLGTRIGLFVLTMLIIILIIFWAYNKKKRVLEIRIIGNPTSLSIELYKKFGSGFTEEDEEILRAINLEKETVEEIAIFTDLDKKTIEKRLMFMEQKELLWEFHGTWEINEDSIRNKIPK